jgi:hypothetical protein
MEGIQTTMTLKARVDLTYAGKEYQPGWIFVATTADALYLINQDEADPFNLQDPATTPTLDEILDTIPPFPPVTLAPTSASPVAAGGAASFNVTIAGQGHTPTWSVTKDGAASWITIVSPTTPQSADGAVNYNVAANAGAQRTANMYVNGSTFIVTQAVGP